MLRIRLDMQRNLAVLQPSLPRLMFSSNGQRVKDELRWRSARDFPYFIELLPPRLAHPNRLSVPQHDRAVQRPFPIDFTYLIQIHDRGSQASFGLSRIVNAKHPLIFLRHAQSCNYSGRRVKEHPPDFPGLLLSTKARRRTSSHG